MFARALIFAKKYHGLEDDTIRVIPYVDLFGGKIVYLPFALITLFGISNGMTAGNTIEEALVQGISETYERHVHFTLLAGKATPPELPREELMRYDFSIRTREFFLQLDAAQIMNHFPALTNVEEKRRYYECYETSFSKMKRVFRRAGRIASVTAMNFNYPFGSLGEYLQECAWDKELSIFVYAFGCYGIARDSS